MLIVRFGRKADIRPSDERECELFGSDSLLLANNLRNTSGDW
jgi:hypothetical protein